jgi:hypothetical protein
VTLGSFRTLCALTFACLPWACSAESPSAPAPAHDGAQATDAPVDSSAAGSTGGLPRTGDADPGTAGASASPGGGLASDPQTGGAQDPPGGDGGGQSAGNPLIPARIRRLTNAEYDASVRALLQSSGSPSVDFSFPPDARQGPANSPAGPAFTINDAQRVDPLLADRLDAAAQALVVEARANGKLGELAPCSDPSGAGEECARDFLRSFGAKAYRRPLSEVELESLVSGSTSAFHVGADGYTYEEGIDLLTRVLLQSPGFLYITELGEDDTTATLQLTANEIAAQLSFLLTGGPPDTALLEQAAAGALTTAEGREAEAQRLLGTSAGRAQFVHVIQQWLGIDQVSRREKAASVYPEFSALSPAMEEESRRFIEAFLFDSTGTLGELLTADWTIADAALADFYGVPWAGAGQRTSLSAVRRRGILNQGAFLSVFASNNGSHPVYRGVALMRRIACLDTPDPGALGLVVSFPAADPSRTTRERFEVHAADPECAGCHSTIDALGFAMENFDGVGRMRTSENDRPVDTSVTLTTGTDVDGTYADSTELLNALAESNMVRECLARRLFTGFAARSDESVAQAENAFVEIWTQLPVEQQGRLVDVAMAYVKSPLFIQRSRQ